MAGSVDPELATPELLTIDDLTVRYRTSRGMRRPSSEVVAVDRVSLSIEQGRTLGLVGATGSGKSTIAQVVMGMVAPSAGSIRMRGLELTASRGRHSGATDVIQVVMQDPFSSLDPRMRVGSIVAEPLTKGRPVVSRAKRAEINRRVNELLGLVGLRASRARNYPHEFSGGQRQRIAIARALAPRPDLIVLDEPTSALDVSVRAQILTLLKKLQDELRVTYLVISHDLVTVAYLASDVAVMHLGRIVEKGPTRQLFTRPRHPYTLELLASIPGASGSFLAQPRPVRSAAGPLPATACRYAHRCALRARLGSPDLCTEADPQLTPDGGQHQAACHFSDKLDAFTHEAAVSGDARRRTETVTASRPPDA